MSFPYYVKGKARLELGRKWGLASAAKRAPSELDDYTLDRRALYDARGAVVREGCDFYATGEVHWEVRRSVRGRTDQYDYIENGALEMTAGKRKFLDKLKIKIN